MSSTFPSDSHRFHVGQRVRLVGFSVGTRFKKGNAAPKGSFLIVRLLPAEGGVFQYRIQSTLDEHERVVVENEIELL